MICIYIYIYIVLWTLYEFGYIFRLFLHLKNLEQIARTFYDLVAFSFDSYTLRYYGIYKLQNAWHKICMIWLHFQNDFRILNYHDIYIYNFRTNDVKFCMNWLHVQDDFCILNYHDIYIYNFRINDMKFAWISCISDHFCILEYDDIFTDLFFRTNDMKIAQIWLHFKSFLYLTK